MALAGGSTGRVRSTVDATKITARQTFPASTARGQSRGRVIEVTELAMPDPLAFVCRAETSVKLHRRQRFSAGSLSRSRGIVRAIVSADPLAPPQGKLFLASVADRATPPGASHPFSGSAIPRGYLTTIDFQLEGQELDQHAAYFSARLAGTETVVISKTTGGGIKLGQPSPANERGIQTQDGWMAIDPSDTLGVTLVADSVLLEYEFWLDDSNGRKYLLESGRFAIARPGAIDPRRW